MPSSCRTWRRTCALPWSTGAPRSGETGGDFLLWRRKFETYTGDDCSRFYDANGSFLPLNATAVLESYLAQSPEPHFERGQRYSFGHPVPD